MKNPFKWMPDEEWDKKEPWEKIAFLDTDFTSCNDDRIEYDTRGNILWEGRGK